MRNQVMKVKSEWHHDMCFSLLTYGTIVAAVARDYEVLPVQFSVDKRKQEGKRRIEKTRSELERLNHKYVV